VQSEYARTAYEDYVSHATKLGKAAYFAACQRSPNARITLRQGAGGEEKSPSITRLNWAITSGLSAISFSKSNRKRMINVMQLSRMTWSGGPVRRHALSVARSLQA
jgi:hypothetical protein